MWRLLLALLMIGCPLLASSLESEIWGDTSRLTLEDARVGAVLTYDRKEEVMRLESLRMDLFPLSYGMDDWEKRTSFSPFDSWVYDLGSGGFRFSTVFPDPSSPSLVGYYHHASSMHVEVDLLMQAEKQRRASDGLLDRVSVQDVPCAGVVRIALQSGGASSLWEMAFSDMLGLTGYVDTSLSLESLTFTTRYGQEKWPLSYQIALDAGALKANFERRYGPESLVLGKPRSERRIWSVSFGSGECSFSVGSVKRNKQRARIFVASQCGPFVAKGSLRQGGVRSWSLSWNHRFLQVGYGSSGFFCQLAWERDGWRWTVNCHQGRRVSLKVRYRF